MPTSKSARERMKTAVAKAIADGDNMLANEITANVMVGTVMLLLFTDMILCLLLNELGVFTVDKVLMRWTVLVAALVEVPITVLNAKYVGTKSWLRLPLMIDLILICSIFSSTLGHNVTLCMVFPVVVSTRYFNKKYTEWVTVVTAVVFTVSCALNGLFGVVNLNMVHLPGTAALSFPEGGDLRQAVMAVLTDRGQYTVSLFLNEFIPRLLLFALLAVACCYISGRGSRMIELQSETARKTARIETELDLATRIQTSMLPCLLPAFPEHKNIELRAVYHPAKEVGGDFYDYFRIDDTHVGVVIADVSGKGVGAALFMTISKTVLKNQLQLGISPAQAMTNANNQLCEGNDAGLFVTCWAGVYDTESGLLTFVNAGHNPPVILRKDEKPQFITQRSGFVLAGLEDFRYKQEQLQLAVGDEMFFYTDGVTEATDTANQLYGNERLLACLARCSNTGVYEQLETLKRDIDAFVGGADQFDDITIMGMRIS